MLNSWHYWFTKYLCILLVNMFLNEIIKKVKTKKTKLKAKTTPTHKQFLFHVLFFNHVTSCVLHSQKQWEYNNVFMYIYLYPPSILLLTVNDTGEPNISIYLKHYRGCEPRNILNHGHMLVLSESWFVHSRRTLGPSVCISHMDPAERGGIKFQPPVHVIVQVVGFRVESKDHCPAVLGSTVAILL